jgi:putative SOS response-associated peptidase YedK
MCGRFESEPSSEGLVEQLKQLTLDLVVENDESTKTVNIAPTEKIHGLRKRDEIYLLSKYNWGIKFSPDSPLIFNSRMETILEKKFWMETFDRNRCLVPMSAFYEWTKEGGKKIPYRIFLKDEPLFFVPALYHVDKDKNIFASLLTTTPNDFIKNIHHRMPVIFTFNNALSYFTNTADENLKLCIPFPQPEIMFMERAYL